MEELRDQNEAHFKPVHLFMSGSSAVHLDKTLPRSFVARLAEFFKCIYVRVWSQKQDLMPVVERGAIKTKILSE